MARGPIYIMVYNGQYLTNRTNAKKVWEQIQESFGVTEAEAKKELEFHYQENEDDTHYEIKLARKENIKPLCVAGIRNKLIVLRKDSYDNMKIFFDTIGGS